MFSAGGKGTEVSGLDGPGVGSIKGSDGPGVVSAGGCGGAGFWSVKGRGRILDVSIKIGLGLIPLGGDSVEVAKGAKSPEVVGGGLLDDGLIGTSFPASRFDDALDSCRVDVESAS